MTQGQYHAIILTASVAFILTIIAGTIAHQTGLLGLFTPFLVFDLLFQSTR